MRKVLLTTTALVALGGVSAASALDISGFQRVTYHSWDDSLADETGGANDTKFSDEFRLVFKHSVTGDNGLTASGYYRTENMAKSYTDLSLTGDFGTISLGNYTTAGGWMYNSHIYNGTFKDNNNQTFANIGTSGYGAYAAIADGADNSITYTAPAMGGLEFMATFMDAGSAAGESDDVTEYGLAYSGAMGDISYRLHGIQAKGDDTTGTNGDEQENQEFGLNLDSGAFGFRYTTSSRETNNTSGVATADIEVNEYAVTYQASDDLKVGVITQSRKDGLDTTNNPKLDETIFGANYTLMPGVLIQASYVDFDYEGATNNSGSQTNVAFRINF